MLRSWALRSAISKKSKAFASQRACFRALTALTKSLSSFDGQPDGKAVIERFQRDQWRRSRSFQQAASEKKKQKLKAVKSILTDWFQYAL